jgi:hypothetical protein
MVTLVANWEFPEFDDERLKRGEEMPSGGNGHQSELSPGAKFMIGTDEIFDPFFTMGMITSGPFAGFEFALANAGGTPPIGHHDTGTGQTVEIDGPTTWVGLACTGDTFPPAPAEGGTALISRGVCAFQEKLNNVVAAGYTAGIVFNSAVPGCNGLVTMLADGDIPFVFVAREVGLKILGIDAPGDAACATPCSRWQHALDAPGRARSTSSSARSTSSARPAAGALRSDDRARPPRVDGAVGAARVGQDHPCPAAGRVIDAPFVDAVGGHERRRRRARADRRGASLDRPGGRSTSCSSTRSTASTRPSRTRCCRRSRTARSRSSERRPRTRTSRSTRRCSRGCACSDSSR